MKQKLFDLYVNYFSKNNLKDEEILNFSRPFLIDVNDEYINSDKKVMIIGQETYTWYGLYKDFLNEDNGVKSTQDIYRNFMLQNKANYNSPFWNFFNKLEENSNASFIWNNVYKLETIEYLEDPNKLGQKVGFSLLSKNKEYKHLIEKVRIFQKDILIKEIEILKPDIVIFLTGHPYDSLFMDKQFSNIQNFYQNIEEAILLKIDKWKFGRFENEHLPYKTYRTYHPNYLNRASSKVLTAEQKDLIFNFFKKQVM